MFNFDGLKKAVEKPFPNSNLLDWYDRTARELPWRESANPYRIWLSEIILQQTRVDQGLPYYERFVEEFPTVKHLANASEDAVLKLWEGLGYYSRARNLHFTAKYISGELNGEFPSEHKGLLALKGVGPYTAAAIGSIAFNLPVAAVDGNVYRVLARYFGIEESIDETPAKRAIAELAQQVLSTDKPGDHNQAMMELGALICLPKNADCASCPLQNSCVANRLGIQDQLPVRTKKVKVRDRFFYYTVYVNGDEIAVNRREEGDIWAGLYEFPLVESDKRLEESEILEAIGVKRNWQVTEVSDEFKHILSHQRIYCRFVVVKLTSMRDDKLTWLPKRELRSFAFPRLINRFLEKSDLVINREVSNI